jgi:TPR repeat protein
VATYYHYGYRGIAQNLTLALQYYDIAAQAGSWEAAGFAGWFHVFGLGMDGKDRDLFKAHKYFRQGVFGGLSGCKERHMKKKQYKQQDSGGTTQCDPACLNGMGLLYVFGVPLTVDVDMDTAIEYFTLAKDMGHADAAYNLAMVTLGWKHNFVPVDEAVKNQDTKEDSDGSTTASEGMTKVDLPSFMEPENQMASGPSQFDMKQVVQYLMIAVQKGHLQARHRLALLYDTGVLSNVEEKGRFARRTNSKLKEVLPQDCDMAVKHYKTIIDTASPHVLHRLRSAYKDYIAGDTGASLIKYMSLAELGNDVAQVNAAFLLEQGTCLGLSPTNCHKASVRYWKAAAETGNAEACLRVGDFYYYGKLRPVQDPLASMWERPFGWAQYLIFPEKYLLPAVVKKVQEMIEEVSILVLAYMNPENTDSESEIDEPEAGSAGNCDTTGEEGTCSSSEDPDLESKRTEDERKRRLQEHERDLKMAAHYYRIAAEKHSSPRANYNLAFLHEWGLGLTQDFPLAKRHYDLAASAVASSREADLAVQIALWTLALHEYVVRIKVAWEDYWDMDSEGSGGSATIMEAVPRAINQFIGRPVAGPADGSFSNAGRGSKTKVDVVLDHLLSLDSLPILILTIVLIVLIQRILQRNPR